MLKKLQRRFIAIAMISELIVILLVLGLANFICYASVLYNAEGTMNAIIYSYLNLPIQNPESVKLSPDGFARARFFYTIYDNQGNIVEIDNSHILSVDDSSAEQLCNFVKNSSRKSGYINKLKFSKEQSGNYTFVVFLDVSADFQIATVVLKGSAVIAVLCMSLLFGLILFFSKRAMKPIAENIAKQKEFITDAGHELKTPLAIISANTEVIELENGESEWTRSIKNQTKRLSELVKNLLILAKNDENNPDIKYEKVNLSELLEEVCVSFDALAATSHKTLNYEISPELCLNGDKRALHELCTILIDNAIKYSADNCIISVSLKKNNKNIRLEVKNPVDKNDSIDTSRLFDRFYRADSSRARETGGYGIGLSVANAIVVTHKGSISAELIDGNICFKITF